MGRPYADKGVLWAAVIEPPSLDGRYLQPLLDCLVRIDLEWLREHRNDTPPLYKAGVRYRREPRGRERWASIPVVRSLKYGDCEDLAAWRTAELITQGFDARAVFRRKLTPSGQLYHIVVRHPDGTIEDPSRILGM